MIRHELLGKCWSVLEADTSLRRMNPNLKWTWLELVQAIHQAGDGNAVAFGPQHWYRSRARLAHAFNLPEAALVARIDALAGHGLLSWRDDGAIALPPGLGLSAPPVEARPREPFRPVIVSGGRAS